jgi:septal ring factor EnvC (AmiA/AmiB activator)
MRLFSEESLRENLLAAGFSSVRVASENAPEFGVEHSEAISLPIVALKGKFIPPAAELAREYRDAHRLAVHHEGQLKILRNEYERYAAHHEAWHKETARELDKRYEWGAQLQRKLTELEKELMVRTEWALGLDREIADLRQRVAELKEEHARLEARKWMRVGRRLGAID